MTTNGPPQNLNFLTVCSLFGVWWPKSVLFVSVCDARVCTLLVFVFYFSICVCVLFANQGVLNSCCVLCTWCAFCSLRCVVCVCSLFVCEFVCAFV